MKTVKLAKINIRRSWWNKKKLLKTVKLAKMNTGVDENFAVSQTKVDKKCQILIKLKIWQNLMKFSCPFF